VVWYDKIGDFKKPKLVEFSFKYEKECENYDRTMAQRAYDGSCLASGSQRLSLGKKIWRTASHTAQMPTLRVQASFLKERMT
jgi:hypothetical protein